METTTATENKIYAIEYVTYTKNGRVKGKGQGTLIIFGTLDKAIRYIKLTASMCGGVMHGENEKMFVSYINDEGFKVIESIHTYNVY